MIGPVVDNQLAIYPQPYAIIRSSLEGVRLGEQRLNLAGPADRKGICANRRIGRACTPIEVDCGIGSGQHECGKVHIIIVIAVQAGSVPRGRVGRRIRRGRSSPHIRQRVAHLHRISVLSIGCQARIGINRIGCPAAVCTSRITRNLIEVVFNRKA